MRFRSRLIFLLSVYAGGSALARSPLPAHPQVPALKPAATTTSQDTTESIRKVLSAQQEAWNRGDIQTFLLGYWDSPDLTFSGSDGIVRGYDGLLARYRKNYPDRPAMGELDFSGLEIHPLGADAALVLGHWSLKRQAGDVGGVFTLVFRRLPEGWRIIHDHTSTQKQTR